MNIEEFVYKKCKTKECEGKFYCLGKDGIENCKCHNKLLSYSKYQEARIPLEWWEFKDYHIEKDFSKEILKKYNFFKENINLCLKNRVQFWFYGGVGTGKTTISHLMLKDVVDNNIKGLRISGFEVIDYLYHDRKSEMDDKEFLVIDEFDKLKKSTIDDFCNLVSYYLEDKSIILSGNKNLDMLKNEGYPDFFIDRLKSLTKITFKSDSYRGKIKDKFNSLMENE